MKGTIGRRSFLKKASMTAAGLSLGPLGCSAPTSWPVSLFFGLPYTGHYSSLTKYLEWGAELAIEEFGGRVLDRPIEVIKRDVHGPESGVKMAREAVEEHGCRLLTVGPNSSTVLAVSDYAYRAGVVLMGQGGSDRITGDACNRSTFRWPVPTWGATRAVLPVVMDEYQARTFYTITPKYVFGEDLLRNVREVVYERKGVLLGNAYHSVGETDFKVQLARARASGADCMLLLNFGDDTVNCLNQARAARFRKSTHLACLWGAGIRQMEKVDPQARAGVFWGLQYYHAISTEANRAFVNLFKKKYGQVPSYLSATLYTTTKALLEAVARAGSDDPDDVIDALEGYRYAGLTGREEFRECDHQGVKPFYVVRCKDAADMSGRHDLADIIGYSVNLQACGANGCSMGLFGLGG